MNSKNSVELNEHQFVALVLCAFRYAIKRECASLDIAPILIHYKDYLPEWVKEQIKRDIEFTKNTDGFESVVDMEKWNELKEAIV